MATMMRAARTIFSLKTKSQHFVPSSLLRPNIVRFFVPGLANVDDVHTISAGLPEVSCRSDCQLLVVEIEKDEGELRCM
jgi:hypothetical protein